MRVNFAYRWLTQHIPFCISRGICGALAHLCARFGVDNARKGKKSPLGSFLVDHPSFVSLGSLVTCACRSYLNSWGGVSGYHAGRTDPHPKLHPQQKLRRRARTNANTNTTGSTTTKSPKQAREIPHTPENYKSREDIRAKYTKVVFCARACLCKNNKVGFTRHDDGAECSLLILFS